MIALTSRAGKRQQAENRRDENAPDRERHAHQGHAAAARLQALSLRSSDHPS